MDPFWQGIWEWPPISSHAQARPVLEICPEKTVHVPLNISATYPTAIFVNQLVSICKNRRKSAARVPPFVDELFEHARVGMLWDETGTQQFNPLARDFFDHRRIVHEPPASERH